MSRFIFVRMFSGIAASFWASDLCRAGFSIKNSFYRRRFSSGGSVDTVARVIGDGISKDLGQTVLVENKTGATGIVAANFVAISKPDGYTLLLVPGGHALYGATFKSLPFKPVDGFEWISGITSSPFYVAVAAKSDFKTLADLVANAKANPGVLKFGSVGPGSPHHLGVELLGQATGAKFTHVPYRGEGPLVAALQQGEIDFSILTPIQVVGAMNAGSIRGLAVTTSTRSPRSPEIPTVQEAAGIKDFDVGSWFALAGPAGIPADAVTRLNGSVRKTLQTEEAQKRLQPIGGEVAPTTPKKLRDRVARELAIWTKIVELAGVEKQ